MATTLRLPKVVSSPTTVQYYKPARETIKPFYKPRFSMPREMWLKTVEAPWLKRTDPLMPPYPYEKNVTFREADSGLYGGATIQSGKKISKGRNKGKTLRKWFPNVRLEKIRSEALDQELSIPITARVMRTITKCGGLDQYLLGDKPARIKELGLLGWKLRWHILKSPKIMEERAALGLPKSSPIQQSFEDVWNDETQRQELISEQEMAWEKLREKVERLGKEESMWRKDIGKEVTNVHIGTLLQESPSDIPLPTLVEGQESAQPQQKKRPKKKSQATNAESVR